MAKRPDDRGKSVGPSKPKRRRGGKPSVRPKSKRGSADRDILEASAQTGRPARHSAAEDAAIRAFAIDAARLVNDLHCTDVVLFDVRELSGVTDYVLVATGTSDRQIKSVGDNVEELAVQLGLQRFGREIDGPSTWLVLDFVDVMVHLFEPATRAHYDLEMLWGDAPKISWRR